MDIKVWPRREDEKGGTICMPLRVNVPAGRSGWKLLQCPSCGALCWKMPEVDAMIRKDPSIRAFCTMCALKGL